VPREWLAQAIRQALEEALPTPLPKSMREALGLKIGDTVFLKCELEDKQVRLAPAVSPFDILAEHAIREYREGRTKTVEEYAREHGIRLNE